MAIWSAEAKMSERFDETGTAEVITRIRRSPEGGEYRFSYIDYQLIGKW